MKDWIADYSLKMTDGEIREGRTTLEAASIEEAMTLADRFLVGLEEADMDIDDAVLWGICIAADPDMENADDPAAVF